MIRRYAITFTIETTEADAGVVLEAAEQALPDLLLCLEAPATNVDDGTSPSVVETRAAVALTCANDSCDALVSAPGSFCTAFCTAFEAHERHKRRALSKDAGEVTS